MPSPQAFLGPTPLDCVQNSLPGHPTCASLRIIFSFSGRVVFLPATTGPHADVSLLLHGVLELLFFLPRASFPHRSKRRTPSPFRDKEALFFFQSLFSLTRTVTSSFPHSFSKALPYKVASFAAWSFSSFFSSKGPCPRGVLSTGGLFPEVAPLLWGANGSPLFPLSRNPPYLRDSHRVLNPLSSPLLFNSPFRFKAVLPLDSFVLLQMCFPGNKVFFLVFG